LDNGADIHCENDMALIHAVFNGNTDTVELLLNHVANIHCENDWALRIGVEKWL